MKRGFPLRGKPLFEFGEGSEGIRGEGKIREYRGMEGAFLE